MFTARLKELRKAKNVSQTLLAEMLGVSQQAVGKWDSGRSSPDPQTVADIASYFGVTADYLLGCSDMRHLPEYEPTTNGAFLPVIGTVRAGYGALAFEDDYGTEIADVRRPEDYFYLMVRGDSMEPRIHSGDLALVRRQADVNSGDLAVVLVDEEEGTLKKVIKKDGMLILQPFNPSYPAMIYSGEDLNYIQIVGKVVETKTRW
ncbi:MAG: helix-turn-helix domain-containing protein [Oscillospiraceae bacterium]|nr:helix-turn-helix domain-containing protein [Oscillospiraceae bacterium]